MARRSGVVASLVLAVALGACSRGGDPPASSPEEALALADSLLEAGDTVQALALLERYELLARPEGLNLAIDAWVMSGQYDLALSALGDVEGSGRVDETRRMDVCAMAALHALEASEGAAAVAALAPCAETRRVDLAGLRLWASAVTGEVPEPTAFAAALARVRAADPGPEVDVAAEALEAAHLASAELSADDAVANLHHLRRAFEIGQAPELGERLLPLYFETAERLGPADPQTAATLYEHIILRQIDGLEISDDDVTRAGAAARETLFSVFVENYEARYRRKWLEADVADGVAVETDGAVTFTFDELDSDAGRDAFHAWVYQRNERPRPTPDAGFFEVPPCDGSAVCTFSLGELTRWVYDTDRLERARSERLGVPLVWPNE